MKIGKGEEKMAVDRKGKEILEELNYEKIRDEIIEGIIRRISKEGTNGCNLREIIENTLKEENFSEFINRMVKKIQQKTDMSEEESKLSASYLIQEDVGDEIQKNMEGEIEEITEKEENIQEKGKKEKLWTSSTTRILGKRHNFFLEFIYILKRHFILRITIITGIVFLIISAILFQSVYKAILVGLTLTAFEEEPFSIKIANLLGGIGGILIFFTSLSIVLQHLLTIRSRDEMLREIARRFLEKKGVR
ncbi:hypothetical protein J7L87_05760 [bacterium]|nr:hypothetical protein [bacterium]